MVINSNYTISFRCRSARADQCNIQGTVVDVRNSRAVASHTVVVKNGPTSFGLHKTVPVPANSPFFSGFSVNLPTGADDFTYMIPDPLAAASSALEAELTSMGLLT
jgi:hypothetical protein